MNNRFIINFQPGATVLHRLTGATKVRSFLIFTVYLIISLDMRMILPVGILGLVGMVSLKPNWKPIKIMFLFITLLNLLNLVLLYFADPALGTNLAGSRTVLLDYGPGWRCLYAEELWYLAVRFLKMLSSFTLSMVFILSITPSEFAAGLYSIKVPYRICMVVSLAFRCIPDIAMEYSNISTSMQARGMELDAKRVGVATRLKQALLIIIPLVLSSFEEVGNIADAMDLRGFGRLKKRSWYSEHEMSEADKIARVIYIIVGIACLVFIANRIFNPAYREMWYPFA